MAVTLAQWLGSRSPAQIAAVLTARPDVAAPPVPRHLRELAERLEIFSSVAEAAHVVPTPAIQVIEVLQLLGPDGGTRAGLADWLGCSVDDADLTSTLDLLGARALVWPDGHALRMAEPLYATFRHPLRLGPPAAALLGAYSAEQLRAIARTLGLPPERRKNALVTAITTVLADGDRVRQVVAGAAATTRAALTKLAVDGPPATSFSDWYGYYQYQPDPHLRWALERGLAVSAPPGPPLAPREVAVALRGPGWHAPFTPQRPDPPLAEVDPAAVEREAAAAGSAAVEQVTALLEAMSAAPVSMLKAGGVGVKELRRLAKVVGVDEATVRLWLEMAYEAELVAPVRDGSGTLLLPSAGYDGWAQSEPADRLIALLPAWVDLPISPLLGPPDGESRPPAALTREHEGRIAAVARRDVIGFAASLPPGRAVPGGPASGQPVPGQPVPGQPASGLAGLAAAVRWHSPLLLAPHPDADRLISAAWREAQLVGAVAHGAITPLGRALAAGSYDDLVAAATALLPAAVGEAIFQADLTALVPGTPAGPLAALLDSTADRETRGGAVTWRFSAGSVRRAMDGGALAEELLASLRTRAAGGSLPQPLEYLVADVARRHGMVRVRAVACVLRAEDPALLAEIGRARALRALQLSVIAPTVLGSAAPADQTLAALREAGYAPVGESTDGAPLLERVERRRAQLPRRRGPQAARHESPQPPAPPPDPMELAIALLAAPLPPPKPPKPAPGSHAPVPVPRHAPDLRDLERQLAARGFVALAAEDLYVDDEDDEDDVAAVLAELAGHLAPGEQRLLAHAIETSHPVEIEYTNAQGSPSLRVIEPMELDGTHLIAWCQLRDDERVFALHRIGSVAPAAG